MKNDPNPVLIALGWLLAVLGGLWTLLAGCCTLYFLATGVAGMAQGGSAATAGMLPVALIFGAVGIAPGALITWGGIAIIRSQSRGKRSGGDELA